MSKKFKPTTPDLEPDEFFEFLCVRLNVTEGYKLRAGMEPDTKLSVAGSQSWLALIKIDADYAMSEKVDLSRPILLGTLEGEKIAIDGNHRLYRAMKENVEFLMAYELTEEETLRIMDDGPTKTRMQKKLQGKVNDALDLLLAERNSA